MDNLYILFGSLVGVALLIEALIGLLKKIGLIKDGQSGKWHTGLQVIAFVLVAALDIFNIGVDWTSVDSLIGMIATLVLGLLGMIQTGETLYAAAKGRVPIIGFTYSKKS